MEDFVKILYPDHYYTSGKNYGPTKVLKGDVTVLLIFVSDDNSSWTKEDINEYYEVYNKAQDYIMDKAKSENVKLNLKSFYLEVRISGLCTNENSLDWVKKVISFCNQNTIEAVQMYYEACYDIDDIPVMLVINKSARSFARSSKKCYKYTENEYSVVYKTLGKNTFHMHTIIHELLHQFGAIDYYYPKDVKENADKFMPKSIMDNGWEFDSLTKYNIGWTNTVDANTMSFLEATKHHTGQTIAKALEEEWKRKI